MTNTAPAAPDCDTACVAYHHSTECKARRDAWTDALMIAEAADALAAAAETVDEIDAAVTALRAVPSIAGRNSRPTILALFRRRTTLTAQGGVHEPTVDGPCPGDWEA